MLEAGVSFSKETNPWNYPVFYTLLWVHGHRMSWDLMGLVPKGEILSRAILFAPVTII